MKSKISNIYNKIVMSILLLFLEKLYLFMELRLFINYWFWKLCLYLNIYIENFVSNIFYRHLIRIMKYE